MLPLPHDKFMHYVPKPKDICHGKSFRWLPHRSAVGRKAVVFPARENIEKGWVFSV
jgi:hypothetical protein